MKFNDKGICIDRFRYDRHTGKYVQRKPYFYDEKSNRLIEHPLHHILFSRLLFYRWIIGGNWVNESGIWIRMENCRKEEFCEEHFQMEPCPYCAAESAMYE